MRAAVCVYCCAQLERVPQVGLVCGDDGRLGVCELGGGCLLVGMAGACYLRHWLSATVNARQQQEGLSSCTLHS